MIIINKKLKNGDKLNWDNFFEFSKVDELLLDTKKVNIKFDFDNELILVETLSNDSKHIQKKIEEFLKEKAVEAQKTIDIIAKVL